MVLFTQDESETKSDYPNGHECNWQFKMTTYIIFFQAFSTDEHPELTLL